MIDNRELDALDKALLSKLSRACEEYCQERVRDGFIGVDALARSAAIVAMGLSMLIGGTEGGEAIYNELSETLNKRIRTKA